MQRFSKFSDVAFSGECSELLIGVKGSFGKVTPREMVAIEKALSVSLAMEQLKKRSTKHKAKKTKE